MPNLEICSLSLNKIQTLRDFVTCKRLSELYLRKNLVYDLQEVKYLTQCPQLKVLWLQDNPISEHPLYRQYIIKLLPNIIKLDSAAVTQEERQEVARINISDQDIISKQPAQKSKPVDDYAYHKPSSERPKSQNPTIKSRQEYINAGGLPTNQPTQIANPSIMAHQQQQINSKNENILCAVLALLKELDENGVVLEYVAKLIAPESIIAQAREIKMNDLEKIESTAKAKTLQPGDLILIRTPSSLYEAFRRLGESYYDHIAVVLDDQMSLHISYPRTKIVPTILFTHKRKLPYIIRPKYASDAQRDEFLDILRKQSLGKQYDYFRVIQIIISQSLYEMKKYEDASTDKIICSHKIYQALSQTMSQLNQFIQRSDDYEYHKLGTFTIQDFVKLAQKHPQEFEAYQLYSFDEIKDTSKNLKDIDFEGISVTISDDKQISKIDSFFKLIGFTKLKDLIDKYEFLQSIQTKSIMLAQQIIQMRKQIIFLITLYKMIDIILATYKEYNSLQQKDEKIKSNTLKKVIEVLQLLAQISIIASDSKEFFSTQVMKLMTRLMIISYRGGKDDFKVKMLRIMNFVMSLQQRIKSAFKL